MAYLAQDRERYEAPACPSCGRRCRVDWLQVTTVEDEMRGEMWFIPGHTWCEHRDCIRSPLWDGRS